MSKFIVIEGGDGSGKTSVTEELRKEYPDAVFTKELGGTVFADKVRNLFLEKELDSEIQLLLAFASRIHHFKNVILPSLESGKTVICDRFEMSTLVYQVLFSEGAETPTNLELFNTIRSKTVLDSLDTSFKPFYIYLSVDSKVGFSRINSRKREKDFFEEKELKYHEKIRSLYLDLMQKEVKNDSGMIIDASKSFEDVMSDVLESIEGLKN